MFSLTFLNSGILFLSSAIIIPVLIYLFAKKKPKKIIFSSIRFIKESQRNQRRKINLKNLLLLIIRILIILLTILAISRPAIKAPFLKKSFSHAKTAVAIIIDNSYSMDYLVDTQTELEKAKNIASEINNLIADKDMSLLLTFDDDWNKLNGNLLFGKQQPNLIHNISIVAAALPLREVISLAEKKLNESHYLNKEIYFVSDMQKQKLPEKVTIPCFFIPSSFGQERINLSCQNAHFTSELTHKNAEKKIVFEIVNHSDFAQTDVISQLILNGRTISEKISEVKSQQRKRENFVLKLEKSGLYNGYVQVNNERLPFDNRSYFAFKYNASPKIAVISDSSDIPLPLRTILEIYTGNPDNIEILHSRNYDFQTLQKYDNIIIYKKKTVSEKFKFILKQFEEKQKKILIITEKQLAPNWEKQIEDIFAVQLKNFITQPQPLEFVNKYHPLTEIIKNDKNILFTDFRAADKNTKATILFSTGNYPTALEKNGNILWLFDVQSSRDPFLLSSAFPVFAYNSLLFLADNYAESRNLKVGDKIRLNSETVELPSGKTIRLANPFFIVSEPGIYRFDNKAISVNLDYSESDYQRMKKIDTKNIKILSKNWKTEIFQTRYGFEIWKILLIAVLLLFALEMLIVKKEEKAK